MNDDVIFRAEDSLGRITLNRPKALNALTLDMVAAMSGQLQAWKNDPTIRAVVVDAVPGRAFCAGGDVRAIYDSACARDGRAAQFFTAEYRLNAAIYDFPKPYVALIEGLCFGGGTGISVHGSYRVVSENTLAGMPETAIGLFPDIGASHFLNRCPGELGMYLALTGARLKAADLLYSGLATHFVPAERIAGIPQRLAQGDTVNEVLTSLAADPGVAPLTEHRAAIDRAFAEPSAEEIIDALNHEGAWGESNAAHLLTLSPSSLKLTHRQMREGTTLDLHSCLRMEYRLATRMVQSHDFLEGVRAAVIDKDQTPRWSPDNLKKVTAADIARYFAPLENAAELAL